MTNPKIKPCPNCKTGDHVSVWTYDNGGRHVECDRCHYLGPCGASIRWAIKLHNADVSKREAINRRDEIRDKVMARVLINSETSCWTWTGPTSGDKGRGKDYPRMSLSGQTVAVHIVMFTNEHGYVPGRKQVDHTCRNRRCVNPAHLELVTHKENQRRRDRARAAITCQEVA